jgi:hypothetical protein
MQGHALMSETRGRLSTVARDARRKAKLKLLEVCAWPMISFWRVKFNKHLILLRGLQPVGRVFFSQPFVSQWPHFYPFG